MSAWLLFIPLGGAAAVVSSAWAIAKLELPYVQFVLTSPFFD